MAAHTTQSRRDEALESERTRSIQRTRVTSWLPARESIAVAAVLLAAAALRLTLAARGWPYSNSDEANNGLMVDDILWHGAHPAFTYGIHHVGALDAYLQAPFFLALGPTNFALHVATTAQILLFLLVLYAFTRAVYSPLVAGVTIALLAIGPYQALFFGLRAGHYAQDMLLLGALLLWLVVLRLRRPARASIRWALNLGIGLVMGLALWSTILMASFVLAGGLALGAEAYRSRKAAPASAKRRSLLPQALVLGSGAVIGMLPFIIVTLTSQGAILQEALQASSGAQDPSLPGGLAGMLVSFGQQIAGTFLVGLPLMLGRETVCAHCPFWPYPGSNPAAGEVLRLALISAPFSLLAVACWFIAAKPLARDAWRGFRRIRQGAMAPQPERTDERARMWGRGMLVIGCGLMIFVYASTRSAYEFSDTSIRYISGIYLCIPLIAEPLCRGAHPFWRWLRGRDGHLSAPARPRPRAWLAVGLLLALFAVNSIGAVNALQETANTQRYGVPAGQRDMQLISFLKAHHATRFYTTWWVCYRLIFDAQEQIACGIVSDTDAFAPGFNPAPAFAAQAAAAAHPAYVFDLTTTEVDPGVPRQLASLIAAGDQRLRGYTSAIVNGYIVFYYAGP
jgi:hypothetical protein